MSESVKIPTFGFARGSVVCFERGGPNMLVVRGLGDTTAVVVCEGDEGGTLRLREYYTHSLKLVLPPDSGRSAQELDDDLSERLGTLLSGVVNALKGPPPDLVLWSFHDAPELAAGLQARAVAAEAERGRLRDACRLAIDAINDELGEIEPAATADREEFPALWAAVTLRAALNGEDG